MDLPTAAPSIRAMADLATPMSIRVAATLSLVERAGSTGATAEQLASETGTAPSAIRQLLDHLVTIGVFDLDTESTSTAPAGAPNSPSSSCSGQSSQALPPTRTDTGASSPRSSMWAGVMGSCSQRSCTPIPTFADRSSTYLRRLPPLPTDSRLPDSMIGPAPFPAASSTPCEWGPTPIFCPTSCTTGTTTTPARSWPGRRAAGANGIVVVIEPVRGRGPTPRSTYSC